MSHVFLSYNHDDKHLAEKVKKALESAGHTVWRDVNNIKGGQLFPEIVAAGLEQSDFLTILITKNALSSNWMLYELNNFITDGKRLHNVLPLKFDATKPSKFSKTLKPVKYIDFSVNFKAGIDAILDRLGNPAKEKEQDSERLYFALDLALRAGNVAMRFYNSSLLPNTTLDQRKNAATSADKAAQLEVASAITSHPIFKDDALIAEEEPYTKTEINKKGYTWVIDPLDGTTNFENRIPFFCTAIGVLYKGQPHIGVVYDPVANEVYYAVNGSPAKIWNISRGGVLEITTDKTTNQLSKCLVGTHISSRPEVAKRLLDNDFLLSIEKEVRHVRALGCGQLALAYVASGRMQLFFQFDSYLWDQVAGIVLVQNAGGLVSELPQGGKWRHTTKDLLVAANSRVRAAFIRKIASRIISH
jgi:myo-inositol-1(or 4)-monophosphatase